MDFSPIDSDYGFLRLMMNNKQIPLAKPETTDDKKLLKACQEFEALFVQQILKEMRKTIPKDGLVPQTHESEVYESMFDEEVSTLMSQQGKLGLAEMLFDQLRDKSRDQKPQSQKVNFNGKDFIQFDGNR
jgi:flagellar protein FlgJ